MANADIFFTFKIIIAGDSGVGKTNFVSRFSEDEFTNIHQKSLSIYLDNQRC